MNRNSSIRNLGLAIALSALALGGCAAQSATDQDLSNEPARRAHMVGKQGANEEGREGVLMNVEHALIDTSHSPVHPATGANLGPRPEPWMDEGDDSNGPRPEPWNTDSDDDNGSPPPSGSSGSGAGSSGGSTGTGTGSGSGGSSGGNPAKK